MAKISIRKDKEDSKVWTKQATIEKNMEPSVTVFPTKLGFSSTSM